VAHGLLGKLSRIDPQFGQVTRTIDVATPSAQGAVAVGGGSVWAVYADATLAEVDPSVTRIVAEGLAGNSPIGIVYANAALWVANSFEHNVYRFSPRTFEEGALRVVSVGRSPSAIAFGAGAIWVANAGDGTVTRIDPSDNSTSTVDVGDRPTAVAAAADAVWVADQGGTVSRIDPMERRVTKVIDLGNPAAGVTVAAGLVWVTVQPR
jgi:serine/threonine-protein kinase